MNGSETRVNEAWDRMLAGMRIWMLRLWKRRVASSFWFWWKIYRSQRLREHLPVCQPSVDSGLTALGHAVDASWWEWDRGSAPFFWRYPPEWVVVLMRDGLPPRFTGDPTQYTKRQIPPRDPETREKERRKVDTVRQRGYVRPFPGLKALLNFFSVSKGGSDIRMVYDGTASGLNAVLYAPWFALTTLECMLRSVGPDTYSADNDYGEMFHNFWMHPVLRQYCGIDLTGLFPDEAAASPGGRLWEAWNRCVMGMRPSPYQAVQSGLQLKQLALGDRHDETNVFRWSSVRLNLPGDPRYDPTLPWVSKLRRDGITLAADVHQFVDDLRETGPTAEETWLASSRVAKTAAHFGCQDAARKRRLPLLSPGAWAGSVIESTSHGVYKRVSQARWDKTKDCLVRVAGWLNTDSGRMPHKELERIRGFLVYVATTYEVMTPYLRGIHLTLDSWRPNRDADGWARAPDQETVMMGHHCLEEEEEGARARKLERPRRRSGRYLIWRVTLPHWGS